MNDGLRLRRFFSLQALDHRLKPGQDPLKQKRIISSASTPARWGTLEFKLYYAVFLVVVPLMFKQGFDISRSSHPNYEKYSYMLSDGWLFGRKVDNSDTQYSFFRNNIFLLVILMAAHVILKRVCVTRLAVPKVKFNEVFGVLFVALAHGMNASKILFHIVVCYVAVRGLIAMDKKESLATRKNSKVYKTTAVAFLWAYGILALYINDRYRDFRLFGAISPSLGFLDDWKGIIHRWDVFYNFTLLRTISYNMDYISRYYELKSNSQNSVIQLKELELIKKKSDSVSQEELNLLKNSLAAEGHSGLASANDSTRSVNTAATGNSSAINTLTFHADALVLAVDLTDRERQAYPWSIYDYNFHNYLSYVLYTPLFIAGPILTYNDYLYQTHHTLSSILPRQTAIYALRFAFCVLTMEFTLHFMYVVAIAKARLYEGYTPFQISMIGLFNLNVIWLKLLIPWRFFRLWALLDEMDPPENMIRCMNNNYSAMAFWRAWHRSFNKWVTRYIYIPLGGSKNRVWTSLAVFSFVAVWHDIEFKLLVWGWLIVLFLMPEIFLSRFFAKNYASEPWYRFVCGAGSVLNIWLMMIANIYGFCLGHDGTINLLKSMLFTLHGGMFFVTCSACLFVAVQVMYESREAEKRRGIDVRC